MFKKKLAVAFLGFLLLLLWIQLSKLWTFSLLMPSLFLIFITKNSYEYAKAKKICISKCYFKENSLLYALWTKKTFIFLFSLFIGIALTTSLIFASFNFSNIDIFILFMDTFMILSLYTLLEKNRTFNENINTPIIKNITASINSLVLIIIFFLFALYQTPPSYIEVDLSSTWKNIEQLQYSQSPYIDSMAYVSSLIIATKWWMLSNIDRFIENHYLKMIVYFFQLLGNYVMVFAYSRFILEITDLFTPKDLSR